MADQANRTVIYSYTEWQDWNNRALRSKEDHERLQHYESAPHHEISYAEHDCPVCGWPAGRKGFLRAKALPGEWAFGKLFACPRCWPAPLGRSDTARLVNDGEEWQAQAARVRLATRGMR